MDEKLDIMDREYHIPMEDKIRKDVSVMCNLSQGIRKNGIAIGEMRGKAIGEARGKAKVVINMYKKGYLIEQIAEVAKQSIAEVEAIIENGVPILV